VAVESDGGGRLEEFAVDGGEDADDIVGAGGGLYDASAVEGMLIHGRMTT
jgi:hypothetical protein